MGGWVKAVNRMRRADRTHVIMPPKMSIQDRILANNSKDDDDDNAVHHKVQPLYSVFFLRGLPAHQRLLPIEINFMTCAAVFYINPFYKLTQCADSAQMNTSSNENLQASVELTYFASVHIILGLALNPNNRKYPLFQKHSCHPTKPQPTKDHLKIISTLHFKLSNIKVTAKLKEEL